MRKLNVPRLRSCCSSQIIRAAQGGPQNPVNQGTMFRLRELDRLMHSSVGLSVEDKNLIEPEAKNVAKIEIDPGGSE